MMLRSSNNNKTSEPNTNRTKKKTIGMIAVSIGIWLRLQLVLLHGLLFILVRLVLN